MFQLSHKILRLVVDTLYPNVCPVCTQPMLDSGMHICLRCELHLPITDDFQVPNNEVRKKFMGRLPVLNAGALLIFSTGGAAQHIVHDFKYRGNAALALYMGTLLGGAIQAGMLTEAVEVVVPVPMHPVKQKRRGYNQANEIAKGVAAVLGCEYAEDAVAKVTHSGSQTFLNRVQRWNNVSQAFKVHPEKVSLYAHKHVLLVDDTLTTGATLEALGRALLESAPCKLSVAAVASVE